MPEYFPKAMHQDYRGTLLERGVNRFSGRAILIVICVINAMAKLSPAHFGIKLGCVHHLHRLVRWRGDYLTEIAVAQKGPCRGG